MFSSTRRKNAALGCLSLVRSFVCFRFLCWCVSAMTSDGISKAQNGIRSRSSHCVSSATYTSEAKLHLVSPSSIQPKRFGRINVTFHSYDVRQTSLIQHPKHTMDSLHSQSRVVDSVNSLIFWAANLLLAHRTCVRCCCQLQLKRSDNTLHSALTIGSFQSQTKQFKKILGFLPFRPA